MSDTEEPVTDEPESSSEEVEDSGPAKRVRGTAKSGWCLEFNPGGHGRCPVTVGGFTCLCPCHPSNHH